LKGAPEMASTKPTEMSAAQRKKVVRSIIASKYPDYDPVLAMVEIAQCTDSEAIAVQCHKEVSQYLYPKLKSIEVQVEDNSKRSRDDIIERLKSFDTQNIIEGEVAH